MPIDDLSLHRDRRYFTRMRYFSEYSIHADSYEMPFLRLYDYVSRRRFVPTLNYKRRDENFGLIDDLIHALGTFISRGQAMGHYHALHRVGT